MPKYGFLGHILAPLVRRAGRNINLPKPPSKKGVKAGAAALDWSGVMKGGNVSFETYPRWRLTSPGGPHIDHNVTSGDDLIWVQDMGMGAPSHTDDREHNAWGGYYVSSGLLSNSGLGTMSGDSAPVNYQTFTHTSTVGGTNKFPDTWEGWHANDWGPREHDPWGGNHREHVNTGKHIALESMQIGHDFDILQIGHNNGWYEYDLETNEQVWIAPIAVDPKMGDASYGGTDKASTWTMIGDEPGMHTHFDGQLWRITNEGVSTTQINPKIIGRDSYYWDIIAWWFGDDELDNLVDNGLIWYDAAVKRYRHWFDTEDNENFCKLHPCPYMAIRHKAAYEVCDVTNLEVDDVSTNVVLFEFIPNFHFSEEEKYIYEEAPIVVKNYPPSSEDAPDHPSAGGSQKKQACVVLYNQSRFWTESSNFCNVEDLQGPFSGQDFRQHRHIRHYAGSVTQTCPTYITHAVQIAPSSVAINPREEKTIPSEPPPQYKQPVITHIGDSAVSSTATVDMELKPNEPYSVFLTVKDLNPHKNICASFLSYSLVTPLPRGLNLNSAVGEISGVLPRNTIPLTIVSKVKVSKICEGDHREHTVTITFKIEGPDEFYNPKIYKVGDSVPPVTITMTKGQFYEHKLLARDEVVDLTAPKGPAVWHEEIRGTYERLPTGLSLPLSKDTISGTPTETGTWNFTLNVTNGYESDSVSVTMIVQ